MGSCHCLCADAENLRIKSDIFANQIYLDLPPKSAKQPNQNSPKIQDWNPLLVSVQESLLLPAGNMSWITRQEFRPSKGYQGMSAPEAG